MNDLRKEIEHQFKAHGLLTEDKADVIIPEEGDNVVTVVEENADTENPTETVAIIIAPKGYTEKFADDFKNLPQEWQVFLSEREASTDAKLNDYAEKLQNYQSLDELFEQNKQRLKNLGIEKMQDWLTGLAWLDKQIEEHPAKTLQAIAAIYGVKAEFPQIRNKQPEPEVVARLCQLEHQYRDLTSYLQNQDKQRLADLIRMFGRQTDQSGNLLHPYFDEVKQQVFALLNSGAAADIEQAYENALWLNPSTRARLVQKTINAQTAEAEKAKKAAFAPKGKAEKTERPLTLREEIAKNMAALMD
ncbi:MAG: hypothetical protein J6N49_03105 [Alphaproteobacteria bacterium]|nr:hypothetical protein [Alphaproteobacteria bacterium]